jgi:hypothetical protein
MSSAVEAEIGAVFINAKEGALENRKYHCHRIHQWHNKTKTHKSNGNAFLLDKRQSETRAI